MAPIFLSNPLNANSPMKRHFFLVITALVLLPWGLSAQSSCSDQLRNALRKFDEGLLDDIPTLLSRCLEKGFTNEEKMSAYKLLIQTYLYSDSKSLADQYMIRFLKDFPEYQLDANDTKEFVLLHKSFRTHPIFNIELFVNGTYSLPAVLEYYGVENIETGKPAYESRVGLTIGANYTDNINKDFDIVLGASVSYARYGYENSPFNHTTTSVSFTNLSVGIPMGARYNFIAFKMNYYAIAGIEPSLLISSSGDFTRSLPGGGDPLTGSVDLMGIRRKFDVSPFIGLGSQFKIGTAKFRTDLRLRFATIGASNNALQYSSPELTDKFYYIDDRLLVNQVIVSINYIFSVYKPIKLN